MHYLSHRFLKSQVAFLLKLTRLGHDHSRYPRVPCCVEHARNLHESLRRERESTSHRTFYSMMEHQQRVKNITDSLNSSRIVRRKRMTNAAGNQKLTIEHLRQTWQFHDCTVDCIAMLVAPSCSAVTRQNDVPLHATPTGPYHPSHPAQSTSSPSKGFRHPPPTLYDCKLMSGIAEAEKAQTNKSRQRRPG